MGLSRAPRVGDIVCGYRLLRALGSRARPRYVAARTRAPRAAARVVVEIFEESEAVVRTARALVSVRHAKLVPVRDVVVDGGSVAVESDFVDGEWLADLLEPAWKASPPSLGALLRVLVDVLEGLSALHRARSLASGPLHLVHGEVAPANVLVGSDGVARIAHSLRAQAAAPLPEVVGYLAPEVLLHDQSADERADVFSAGVLLWELLAARRLHSATHAGEIVVRLLGGKVQAAEVPPASLWAQPLAEVAKRALSPELGSRHATAAEMTAAIKSIAGERLGSKQDVVALVETLARPKIRARAGVAWAAQTSAPPAAPVVVAPQAVAAAEPAALEEGADRPTLVPPRSSPPPAPADGIELSSAELEPESERAPAPPPVLVGPRAAPKPPPVSRLSIPTPIVPLAAVEQLALASSARTSVSVIETPPPLPAPPSTAPSSRSSEVFVAPLAPAPMPEPAEASTAPVVAAEESEAPVAPAPPRRRRKAPFALAAAVALLMLAWLVLASSRTSPSAATQASAPDRRMGGARLVTESPTPPLPPAPSGPPAVVEAEEARATPPVEAAAEKAPEVEERTPAAAPATAASAGTEVAAPPPLRKKSAAPYYPLGI